MIEIDYFHEKIHFHGIFHSGLFSRNFEGGKKPAKLSTNISKKNRKTDFHGKIKLTIFFSYRHNSALEDVRSRHHHRRVHQPTTPRENTTTSTEKTSKLNELLDFSTDSTPVSSDVEHSQNPSPRRACQRKRKERRDSIGDGQDKKFSRSSR